MKFLLLLLLCFCSCSQPSSPKPTVLVSITPYAYFVKKIAGEEVHVETLASLGADPHTYEPTPQQVAHVHRAQLWLRSGEPFEERIAKTLSIKTLNMWEDLPLIATDACCHHDDTKDLHVWMSPKLAHIQASRIALALTELFPEKKSSFDKNLSLFQRDLENLDREIQDRLKLLKNRSILVSHPAFAYFCRDYNLVQLSLETEGKEALPQNIEAVLEAAQKAHVTQILAQKQYSDKAAHIVAEKLQLPIFKADPYAEEYLENLRMLAGQIADYN